MTRNARIDRPTPFVAHDMQIGMTYPAEKNLDLHISRGWFPALERERFQWLMRGMSSVAFGW